MSCIDEQMIGQIAIALALHGFNDLGRSLISIFLLMDHFFSDFLRLAKKGKKSIDYKFELFLQNAPSNSDVLSSSFICAAVSNAS